MRLREIVINIKITKTQICEKRFKLRKNKSFLFAKCRERVSLRKNFIRCIN